MTDVTGNLAGSTDALTPAAAPYDATAKQKAQAKTARIPIKAGEHTVGVTFIATNFAPDYNVQNLFLRTTIETGGLAGTAFFPHVGFVRIEGPFNPQGAADTPSRRRIFVCRPTAEREEEACARQILSTLARRAYPKWHDSFTFLPRLRGIAQQHPRPADFDTLVARGQGFAGAPASVTTWLRAQLDETGTNYVVGQFAFGDLTLEECRKSIGLFVKEVMPALRG